MPARSPAGLSRASCSGRWATCRPSRCGEAADKRSDLFSFGTILYEMLSGQRAFRGDTAADTITAILSKEPPDLSQTNKDIHPGLDRIVRHCLEKNPEERFESARDVAFDLEALSGSHRHDDHRGDGENDDATELPAASGGRRGRLAIGAAGGLNDRGGSSSARQSDFSSAHLPQRIHSAGAVRAGRPVDLLRRRLGRAAARDLPDPARQPGLAGVRPARNGADVDLGSGRDGGLSEHPTLGLFQRNGTLARIGITGGGAPREIASDVYWADWTPDGQALAIVRDVEVEEPPGVPDRHADLFVFRVDEPSSRVSRRRPRSP